MIFIYAWLVLAQGYVNGYKNILWELPKLVFVVNHVEAQQISSKINVFLKFLIMQNRSIEI